jgi:hypothetical protein
MGALASICFLVGAVLGLRFKLLILVPAIGFLVVGVIANGIVIGESLLRLALVVAAIAIQLGYVLGMFGSPRSARRRMGTGQLRVQALSPGPAAPDHKRQRCANSSSTGASAVSQCGGV